MITSRKISFRLVQPCRGLWTFRLHGEVPQNLSRKAVVGSFAEVDACHDRYDPLWNMWVGGGTVSQNNVKMKVQSSLHSFHLDM